MIVEAILSSSFLSQSILRLVLQVLLNTVQDLLQSWNDASRNTFGGQDRNLDIIHYSRYIKQRAKRYEKKTVE